MPRTVIETLLEIPSHVRVRLASALESGLLARPWTAMAIRASVGGGHDETILRALQEWECLGVSPTDAGIRARPRQRRAQHYRLRTGPETAGDAFEQRDLQWPPA